MFKKAIMKNLGKLKIYALLTLLNMKKNYRTTKRK